ncbi:MAG TPA: GntR family transcriptional regulator [Burkholderiales bacterium]|nr:GntR family transcriptional regulator [Burkholderiales bacterium]
MRHAPKRSLRRRPPHRLRASPAAAGAPSRVPAAAPQSLTDVAYAHLEEMIVTLQLVPGSAVSEAALSRDLGIGRTPIREALQRLAREKLVTILPRRGIMVSEINIGSQLKLLEVRREIERLVARGAAKRANDEERQRFRALAGDFVRAARTDDATAFMRTDREFNELCLVAARNEFAASAMGLMNSASRRFWFIHYQQMADMPLAAKLHAAVARAIAGGDEAAAARASDSLIDYIEDFTRATVRASG